MDPKLATYLFGDELLYAIEKASELPKVTSKENHKPIESTSKVPAIEKKLELDKQEVSSKSASSVKVEMPVGIENDDFVFKMKTNHLLVFSNLEADEKDFLLKILQALGLSFTKVDLLDVQKEPLIDFKQTIHENVVRTIIFFGEKSGKDFLPKLKLSAYEVKNLKNINFLYSDTLKQVASNEANEKRLLWDALKSIF